MDIQELRDKFLEHGDKADKMQQELKQEFWENYPGEEMPEYLTDDFSLPRALAFMCEEIQKLKDVVCTRP